MSYNPISTPLFERKLKRLAKRYSSMREDYRQFLLSLVENPLQGDALGRDCYKVRMRIGAKNTGKRGGARVITCIKVTAQQIFLLTIYDKSEQESISDKERDELLYENNLL